MIKHRSEPCGSAPASLAQTEQERLAELAERGIIAPESLSFKEIKLICDVVLAIAEGRGPNIIN